MKPDCASSPYPQKFVGKFISTPVGTFSGILSQFLFYLSFERQFLIIRNGHIWYLCNSHEVTYTL